MTFRKVRYGIKIRPASSVRFWREAAAQVCWPYLSVTAAATNFLRPALPGLVPWAAHQSGNVVGSM
jgi:hypothetical protein